VKSFLQGAVRDFGHVLGVGVQVLAAGGGVLFGLDPKIAVVAWAGGKVLELAGVKLNLPATPPAVSAK